jgi:lipid A 3-O-deacylase
VLAGAAAPSPAQTFDHGAVLAVIEENDLFFRTDRHYTQGLKIAYLQRDGDLPRCAAWLSETLPPWGFDLGAEKFGYELGQSIFTPADIDSPQLLPEDRPYAGWLYFGFVLQRRGLTAHQRMTLEHFQLDAGIIGPWSLAEVAQKVVHDLRALNTPAGWDNQLGNEPGIALKYQRSLNLLPARSGPRYLDIIPHAGFSLGNVDTSVRAGALARVGFNLPDDFGVPTIDSLVTIDGGRSASRKRGRYGFNVFTGVEVRGVIYSAFLDGSLFQHSHSVDKKPFVLEWKNGIALILDRVELAIAYVYRSHEFTRQTEENEYGSIVLKCKF